MSATSKEYPFLSNQKLQEATVWQTAQKAFQAGQKAKSREITGKLLRLARIVRNPDTAQLLKDLANNLTRGDSDE